MNWTIICSVCAVCLTVVLCTEMITVNVSNYKLKVMEMKNIREHREKLAALAKESQLAKEPHTPKED